MEDEAAPPPTAACTKMVTNDVNYKDVNFCENYMYIKMTSDVNYKMVIEQLEQK